MKQIRPQLGLHGTALCLLLLPLGLGCAVGKPLRFADLDPFLRRERLADEKMGPTWYQKVNDLRALRKNAPGMSPAEQEEWSRRLAEFASDSSNPLLQEEAVRTLGALPTATAVEALRQAITNGPTDVRIAACEAWGQVGGPDAVQQLATIVGSDTDFDVRVAATRELSRFNDPIAVRAMGVALEDESPALQFRAMESLRVATGRDYGNSVPAWRQFVQGGNPPEPRPSLVQRLRNLF